MRHRRCHEWERWGTGVVRVDSPPAARALGDRRRIAKRHELLA
jgi:hypothetical protein